MSDRSRERDWVPLRPQRTTTSSQPPVMAGNYEKKPLRLLSIETIGRARPAVALIQPREKVEIYETKPLRLLSIETILRARPVITPNKPQGNGRKLRNEAVAAFIERDDWASETGDHAEPARGDGRKLRNEAVAGFIDRDDWASKTGDFTEPATGNGRKLRNEAIAASIDRDDSAGRTIEDAPAVLPREPPDCPRPPDPRLAMLVVP